MITNKQIQEEYLNTQELILLKELENQKEQEYKVYEIEEFI